MAYSTLRFETDGPVAVLTLDREHRLNAEQRLKSGSLQALVATASLELGIDVGEIDLVCQIGSPRSIATLLQRVGDTATEPRQPCIQRAGIRQASSWS